MMANANESGASDVCAPLAEDEGDVQDRIRSEYREMPGLRLTVRQAARLFGVEPATCERMLNALVVDGELSTDGREFLRSMRI
jgi:hypothetical protein